MRERTVFDSGGGGGAAAAGSGGPQTLHVEPPAIPGARDAFLAAHQEVDALIRQLAALNVQPWAGDPVSEQTAQRFAERSNGGDAQAALDALARYSEQLRRSAEALDEAYRSYLQTEGNNAAMWKGQPIEG